MQSTLPLTHKFQTYIDKIQVKAYSDGSARLLYREKPIVIPDTEIPLIAPSEAIAELALAEWTGAFGEALKKSTPMVALLCRAGVLRSDPLATESAINEMLRYFQTDTICFFDKSHTSYRQELKFWDPIINSVENAMGFSQIQRFVCVSQAGQSERNLSRAREILKNLNAYHLATLEMLTRSFKSLLLSLALKETLISADEAVYAANLEQSLQAQQWGHVEDFHTWNNASQLLSAHLGLIFFSPFKL